MRDFWGFSSHLLCFDEIAGYVSFPNLFHHTPMIALMHLPSTCSKHCRVVQPGDCYGTRPRCSSCRHRRRAGYFRLRCASCWGVWGASCWGVWRVSCSRCLVPCPQSPWPRHNFTLLLEPLTLQHLYCYMSTRITRYPIGRASNPARFLSVLIDLDPRPQTLNSMQLSCLF